MMAKAKFETLELHYPVIQFLHVIRLFRHSLEGGHLTQTITYGICKNTSEHKHMALCTMLVYNCVTKTVSP